MPVAATSSLVQLEAASSAQTASARSGAMGREKVEQLSTKDAKAAAAKVVVRQEDDLREV